MELLTKKEKKIKAASIKLENQRIYYSVCVSDQKTDLEQKTLMMP